MTFSMRGIAREEKKGKRTVEVAATGGIVDKTEEAGADDTPTEGAHPESGEGED